MSAPTTSAQFDAAYRAPLTVWGDPRVPREVRKLAENRRGDSVLELGCGLGRFSQFMAGAGLRATGIDFSPVAITKAQERADKDPMRAKFLTADVTRLDVPDAPFDLAFDIGCFHCLDAAGRAAYVSETARVLKPTAPLLIWAMDAAPGGQKLSPELIEPFFAPKFHLARATSSRRRFAASHWYRFERRT